MLRACTTTVGLTNPSISQGHVGLAVGRSQGHPQADGMATVNHRVRLRVDARSLLTRAPRLAWRIAPPLPALLSIIAEPIAEEPIIPVAPTIDPMPRVVSDELVTKDAWTDVEATGPGKTAKARRRFGESRTHPLRSLPKRVVTAEPGWTVVPVLLPSTSRGRRPFTPPSHP